MPSDFNISTTFPVARETGSDVKIFKILHSFLAHQFKTCFLKPEQKWPEMRPLTGCGPKCSNDRSWIK